MSDYLTLHADEFLDQLSRLVAVPSVRDLSTARPHAPFGSGVRAAFDAFCEIAEGMGFSVEDDDGYVLSATAGAGGKDKGDYVGILGHLDVVPAGDLGAWTGDPFALRIDSGWLYGRGVNDDKGPLLASLWALKRLRDEGVRFARPVRVMAGGAEETTWECVEHYFARHPQPRWGFSPDGNFPVVNGEKGILQARLEVPCGHGVLLASSPGINYVCERLEVALPAGASINLARAAQRSVSDGLVKALYLGRTVLSRNPARGQSALAPFLADYLDEPFLEGPADALLRMLARRIVFDPTGVAAGLSSNDPQMGRGSLCLMTLDAEEARGSLVATLDVRWVRSTTREYLLGALQGLAREAGARLSVIREKPLLYVSPQSRLVRALRAAYRSVMGDDPEPITKGGASYARALNCGVAFGATFDGEDPRPHMPNERQSWESLQRAFEIYCCAIEKLAC